MATSKSLSRHSETAGAGIMAKERFAAQPLEQQITILKLIEQDYLTRSQLMDVEVKTLVPAEGDELGLIMRESFNDAKIRDGTRENDLVIVRKRLKELEMKLQNSARRKRIRQRCKSLIEAAQAVMAHSDIELEIADDPFANDGLSSWLDHSDMDMEVQAVWGLYHAINNEGAPTGTKRRRTQE